MNAIIWPQGDEPGFTDTFASGEACGLTVTTCGCVVLSCGM